MLRRGLLALICGVLLLNCGEPIPVDCTPDEEECTTENEGGFDSGAAAGVAAGVAVVGALAGGGLSGSGDESASNPNANSTATTPADPTVRYGVLLDAVVEGVGYQTVSGLSGTTNAAGEFTYHTGDQVTFQIGSVVLGTVTASSVLTPVDLVGASNTADRRVINLARLLQSLDEDGDPSNGLTISTSAQNALQGRSLDFNLPISSFAISATPAVQAAVGRTLVDSTTAMNHLQTSLGDRGLGAQIATTAAIQQVLPEYVVDSSTGTDTSTDTSTDTTTPAQCTFNGSSLESGQSVIAYESEIVPYGESCASQTRSCNNGTLNGTYAFASCQIALASDCTLNGTSVANGTSITAYETASVGFGENCSSQIRTCSNGSLSGSYGYNSCTVGSATSCMFNGQTIAHNATVTAYKENSVSAGEICDAELRSCSNGSLSGSYDHATCTGEQAAASCSFNASTVEHGNSVTAYQSSSVPFGSSCSSQLRTCNDGSLSGSYTNASCSVSAAASCSFNGQTIAHNTTVTAYEDSSVEFGNVCESELRTCNNGSLSGNYSNSSCAVEEADSCSFNGQTIAHGSSIEAFVASSVGYGETCQSETRVCDNGDLSGSYAFRSCTVESLSAPSSVSASDGSYSGSIRVTWSAVSGASGYYVYRATSATGTYSLVGTVTQTSYDDAVSSTSTYYYKVAAYSGSTTSDLSSYNSGYASLSAPSSVSAAALSAGHQHTCALLADGTVQCWGSNDSGRLGDGTYTDRTTPVSVSGIANATALSLGWYHTCALLADGTVKCWGWNVSGQLGDGTRTRSTTPVSVSGISNATAISAGGSHTCALLADHTVQCWGYNSYGQLGDGTTTDRITPVRVSGITNATAISAAGYAHTCALLADGTVQCWGRNDYGQLGDGTTTYLQTTPVSVSGISNASALSLGHSHTCALLADGTVQCWGRNDYGQLGDGTYTTRTTPVSVSGISNATAISLGSQHTCALLTDGTVQCWGRNDYGQLGDGTTTDRITPLRVSGIWNATAISAGLYHTCALLTDGTVKCWGWNVSGQLGDGTTTDRTTPVEVLFD